MDLILAPSMLDPPLVFVGQHGQKIAGVLADGETQYSDETGIQVAASRPRRRPHTRSETQILGGAALHLVGSVDEGAVAPPRRRSSRTRSMWR